MDIGDCYMGTIMNHIFLLKIAHLSKHVSSLEYPDGTSPLCT